MKKKLERKRFKIKDDQGNYIGRIGAVSMVTRPAIEKSFDLFADTVTTKKIEFQVTDQEKMLITGPAMCPNMDIIRYDYEKEEYYFCFFTEQDVRDYSEYFMEFADTRQANTEHEDTFFKDFFIAESWIVENPEMDKCVALGFKDIPKGTWMISYKCTDTAKWEEIKNSSLSGFSVEIELDYFSDLKLEKQLNSILDDAKLSKEEKKEKIRAIIFK